MTPEVVEIERTQELRHLAAPGLGDVVDVGADALHVELGFVEVAGRGLGRGQHLHQVPEELGVEMAAGTAYGEIVELGRGQLVEAVGFGHRGGG